MAYENPGKQISLIATNDLSASQYLFVVADGTGQAVLAGAGAAVIGVLQNKPTAGQEATVMIDGVSQVIANGVIAPGAVVMSDATGKAVTATAGNQGIGFYLGSAASAAGQYISVALIKSGKQ